MKLFAVVVLAVPLFAQESLSLRDAIRLALRGNPGLAAAAAAEKASESRIAQARGESLPKVNFSESLTRSNNPVFVFSSLLTQHQFGPENFNIGPLNRPDSLNNFQSQLTVDQTVYDAGQTRSAVQVAQIGRQAAGEETRRAGMQVTAAVSRAYWDSLLAAESVKTAGQSIRSAEADLARAESIRTAGMSTDADVLSIRVHLAVMTEQRIQRAAELDVARAALNDALGQPLDAAHTLISTLTPLDLSDMELEVLEQEASSARPETRASRFAQDLARTETEAARNALRPRVSVHAGLEADRQRFVNRGGVNWLTSVALRWNLFNGNADKARIDEAERRAQRAGADQKRVESAVRLEVRRAWAGLRAAEQRIEVARAAQAEAEESLRITQNRYAAGMSNVTDLLRNETGVLECRTRFLSAVHDQRVAAAMLELAAGRLNTDSEVWN